MRIDEPSCPRVATPGCDGRSGRIRGTFVIALFVLVLATAEAVAAEPGRLIVKHGRGGWHHADALLHAKRPLALPRSSTGTLLSPDGSRALAYGSGSRMTAVDLRRNRVVATRRIGGATPVAWLTKHQVLTLYEDSRLRTVVRSYDLRARAARRTVVPWQSLDSEVVGRRLRLAVAGTRGRIFVLDVDAGGRVVARRRVRYAPGRSFYTTVQLNGDMAMVSDYERYVLARIGGGSRTVDLPPGYYRWAGRRFVFSYGAAVARVDRRRLSSGPAVTLSGRDDEVQPYRSGLMVGFGHRRLDADLAELGGFPDLPATEGYPLLLANRLYDFRDDCSDFAGGFAIADADTGTLLRYAERGVVRFGVLGAGDVELSSSEDRCPGRSARVTPRGR